MANQFAFPASVNHTASLSTVTAFNVGAENAVHMANSTHPNWNQIIEGLVNGDPNVWSLFDVAGGVMQRFKQISERYSWNGSDILFDGDPVSGPFVDLLTRSLEQENEANYTALAKFGEKVAQNPSDNSREQLFRFLANFEFQITPDGDVVAFKSLTDTGKTDEKGRTIFESGFRSQKHGAPSGIVNGVPVPELSHIPQSVGDVVTLPRSEVVDDPNDSCARGLHVATENYWGGRGRGTVEVHINPRDFVSVPNREDAKARVCRYYVSRLVVDSYGGTVLSNAPTYDYAGDVGYRA